MATRNAQKLNWLLRSIPPGMVVDAAWLTDAGYSTSLRSQYVAAGWLERPARGAYRAPSGELSWETVLASLQHLMRRSLHVGGRSALELHGYGPNLAPGAPASVVVYSDEPLPTWLHQLPDMPRFEARTIAPLFPTEGPSSTADTVASLDTTARYPLLVAVPERAWLELLADVPHRITFEMADAIGDGLRTLRPALLQRLLETVKSVKARRLALWFADRHAQPWRERLDRDRIDLGTGNRTLAPKGRLDPTYRITYPRGLDASG
ncbi:MAG: type IV toxin-antitoxin system AbiEi family antitoxin [Trueperaceae bacterium]|nr:type IV toxin-antitoxin system AbiEi family antitoxin [Trueperaceae bacterium]